MSLPKTPSAFSLPTLNVTNSSSSDASPDNEKEEAEKEDTGTSLSQSRSQQNNDTGAPTDTPSSPRSPRSTGPRPRRAVTFRQLGISEPLTVRPIATASSTEPTSPLLSEGKVDTPRSSAQDKTPLPSTPPRISSRSSSGSPSAPVLSAEQQQYEDLADFVYQQRLGKKSAFDTEIPIENVPKSLLHCVTNLKKPTVRISELMIHLFRKDLNKSDTWVIASEMAVKIKNTFHILSASSQEKKEKQMAEEENLLASCAANFAGAFFNLSTDDKLGRLPASLVAFLEAADHRLIRASGSPGKEGSPDDEAFLKKRHDLLKFLLLDSFLIPVVQQDIFTLRGVAHADRIVGAIINAFHDAVDSIAHAFFAHSIRAARPEVVHDFAMRRISQLRQKPGGDKSLHINTAVASSDNANHLAESLSPRNPIQDRRKELLHLRQELQQKLEPLKLPGDLLGALRENENEIARSARKIDKLEVWEGWLDIAIQQDPHAQLTAAMRDVVEQERERELIDHMLLRIDSSGHIVTNAPGASSATTTATTTISTTLLSPTVTTTSATMIATTTSTRTTTTTTNATTNMTAIAATVPTTNRITTPTTVPVTSSTNNNTVNNTVADVRPDNNLTPARHPITRTPRMVRGKPLETSNSSSPEPVSTRPLTRHQRSRTADAAMPVPANITLQLTDAGRQALLAAFPELILAAMKKIASRHPEHPVEAIRETQRNRLTLELNSIPQTPEKAPLLRSSSAKLPSTVGHDQLLKALLWDAVANSSAGKILATARTQSMNLQRSAASALGSLSDAATDAETLKTQVVLCATQAVQDLFAKNLADSALPAELIGFWIRLDQQITAWAKEKRIEADGIETLRSVTGFDLIITRLLYPLAMGTDTGIPGAEAQHFANDIRKRVIAVWPEIFMQFKALANDRQRVPTPATSTASSASPGSSDRLPPTEKKQ